MIYLCPFCEKQLENKVKGGWECKCGEYVPAGYEKTPSHCDDCSILDVCPLRRVGGDSPLDCSH
ncbi:MAG: hypothetical protein OEV28_11275 [Nitrospirota bacterium]|nr:hypothetical protein [Nitrospirota bacterium]